MKNYVNDLFHILPIFKNKFSLVNFHLVEMTNSLSSTTLEINGFFSLDCFDVKNPQDFPTSIIQKIYEGFRIF